MRKGGGGNGLTTEMWQVAEREQPPLGTSGKVVSFHLIPAWRPPPGLADLKSCFLPLSSHHH